MTNAVNIASLGPAMTADSSGNVAIGTSTPAYKLDVVSTASDGGVQISGGATGANIFLNNTGTGGRKYRVYSTGSSNAVGAGYFGVYDETAGLFRMGIDSSGRVTTPYQPAYKIALDNGSVANSAILNQSNCPQKTGRDEFNVGSNYNHTTGRFTAPVAGTYFFAIQFMRNTSTAGAPQLRYMKNGTSINMWARCYATGYYSDYQSWNMITITQLAVNDYVILYNTDAGPVSIYNDDSYVMGYFLG